MVKKQVFCPGYMTQADKVKLKKHGQITKTTWDAWHFIANENDNTVVYNGNHCLIIKGD